MKSRQKDFLFAKPAMSVIAGFLLFPLASLAADGDYRSAASGNWNATSTWQVESGGSWVAASATLNLNFAGAVGITTLTATAVGNT